MPIYSERVYRSRDGLQLYSRDYSGDPAKVPVLCLHGLTRNCRDFAALALRIAPGRRVITPDAIRTIQPLLGATQAMWAAFGALRITPTLAIRGELSDLLSVATFDRMQREHPHPRHVTVPNRGHVPQLDEPHSLAALEQFLAELP